METKMKLLYRNVIAVGLMATAALIAQPQPPFRAAGWVRIAPFNPAVKPGDSIVVTAQYDDSNPTYRVGYTPNGAADTWKQIGSGSPVVIGALQRTGNDSFGRGGLNPSAIVHIPNNAIQGTSITVEFSNAKDSTYGLIIIIIGYSCPPGTVNRQVGQASVGCDPTAESDPRNEYVIITPSPQFTTPGVTRVVGPWTALIPGDAFTSFKWSIEDYAPGSGCSQWAAIVYPVTNSTSLDPNKHPYAYVGVVNPPKNAACAVVWRATLPPTYPSALAGQVIQGFGILYSTGILSCPAGFSKGKDVQCHNDIPTNIASTLSFCGLSQGLQTMCVDSSGVASHLQADGTCPSGSSSRPWYCPGLQFQLLPPPFSWTVPANNGGTCQDQLLSLAQYGVFPSIESGCDQYGDQYSAPPAFNLDTQYASAQAPASGAVPISGWAASPSGPDPVAPISLYRDAIPCLGEAAPVYLGQTSMAFGARPDVAAAYNQLVENQSAGYGYQLLTNVLPSTACDGTYGDGSWNIAAVFQDRKGHTWQIGSTALTAQNSTATAPFGAVDIPSAYAQITRSNNNYSGAGWALPGQGSSGTITATSQIQIFVDGQFQGNADIVGQYRGDVGDLFQKIPNAFNAGFRFTLHPQNFSNGQHALTVTATDSAGNTAGIVSKFFYVQN